MPVEDPAEGLPEDVDLRLPVPLAVGHGDLVHVHAAGGEVRPGEGEVVGGVFAGDHGYGVVTRYGHNAKIHVKLGQRVKRGEKIASVGNTSAHSIPITACLYFTRMSR